MLRSSGGTVANLLDRWPSLTTFSPLFCSPQPSDSTELSPHSRTPTCPSPCPLGQLFREVSKSLSAWRPFCSSTSHSEWWLSDMSTHWNVNHMILLSPHICVCFISESLCLSAVTLLQFVAQPMLRGPHLGRGNWEFLSRWSLEPFLGSAYPGECQEGTLKGWGVRKTFSWNTYSTLTAINTFLVTFWNLKQVSGGEAKCLRFTEGGINSVQSVSRIWLFMTPWTGALQASLSIINSWSLLKLMSIELVIASNHPILCHPPLLLSIFPSIRVFSNESVLRIRWPKYWSFSFSISPSNLDWLHLAWTGWIPLGVQGTRKSLLQNHSSKASILQCLPFSPSLTSIHDY